MWVYVFKKLTTLITIMFGTTFIAFMILYWFASFDPLADLAARAQAAYPPEVILYQLRELFGHNENILIRYVRYMAGVFTGDFGHSFRNHVPIAPLVMSSLFYTLQLSGIALIASIVTAFPLAIFMVLKKSTWVCKALMVIAQIGASMPAFLIAVFLIISFPQIIGVRIPGLYDNELFLLPIIALSAGMFFGITRTIQISLLDIAETDYIRTARSKGLTEKRVVYKHVLRNALVPILSAFQAHLGSFFTSIVIIEVLLGLRGIGWLFIQSVGVADYPLLLGCFVMLVFCAALLNTLVDIFRAVILAEQLA